MANKQITHYRGRRIEDMTREELIEALNWAANEIERISEQARRQIDILTNGKTAQTSEDEIEYMYIEVNTGKGSS